MTTLPVHVFKASADPFIDLLKSHGVEYQIPQPEPGIVMASAGVVQVAIASAGALAAFATVLVAFLKARSGRKVIITTKDHTVIHAEGLTAKELEGVLEMASRLSVVDTSGASPVRTQSGEREHDG